MTGTRRDLAASRPFPTWSTCTRAPDRSASAARSMSTCCRRAMPAARPGRTSRPGWRTRRRAVIEQAWRELVADNPFPAIHGRVCYHPCESVCNRAEVDSAVSIHAVERFLGDLALEQGWAFDPPPVRSGKRVLVVGAGPSGLSAAYHLARLGHEVEIRDAGAEPGGMMRYRHPRLPDAARRAGRRGRPARGAGGADDLRAPGRGPRGRAGRRAASTRSSSRSARTCPSASTSRPGTPARSWTRCRSCRASRPANGR